MDFPESLAIEFCAVFGRFPRCEGLASVTDGFCIPEAHFDFRFEFFFGGFEFGKFCFYHFQLIAGREDVIANLNDFSLRMAGVFRDNVRNGSRIRLHVSDDVINPKAFNLLNHPSEEVRNKCDVLVPEFSAGTEPSQRTLLKFRNSEQVLNLAEPMLRQVVGVD